MNDITKHIQKIVRLAEVPTEQQEELVEDIAQTYANTIVSTFFESMSESQKNDFKDFLKSGDKSLEEMQTWLTKHLSDNDTMRVAIKDSLASASSEILSTLTHDLDEYHKDQINHYISNIV